MNVDLFQNIYGKSLFENEKNIVFWENYLQNLDTLNLNSFSEKLSVPILVPIGSRILFRGELKHTNEVTVALGADYFAKCSVNQAEILRQHRIKDAKSKLESLKKERDYLQSQVSFTKQIIYDNTGYDIIEVVTDEEDKIWREFHRENVRQYKQRENKGDEVLINDMSNEELWNRLDELELQEELENELTIDKKEKLTSKDVPSASKVVNEDKGNDDEIVNNMHMEEPNKSKEINAAEMVNEVYIANDGYKMRFFQQPSKLDLFEQVLDRHNNLKEMAAEIRARQRESKTEEDLEARLDDMEILEKLEDEIAILEDMLASDDDDDIEEPEKDDDDDDDNQLKKSVAFADEDDSETFEVTFKHSEVEPSKAPYNPQKGITKPSDIYKVYCNSFNGETTSILKKPKCEASQVASKTIQIVTEMQNTEQDQVNQDSNLNSIIVVRDIVEKVDSSDNSINRNARPMSLFKKRRQQLKE